MGYKPEDFTPEQLAEMERIWDDADDHPAAFCHLLLMLGNRDYFEDADEDAAWAYLQDEVEFELDSSEGHSPSSDPSPL